MKNIAVFSLLIAANFCFAQEIKAPSLTNKNDKISTLDFPKFEFGITAGVNAGAPFPTKALSASDKGGLGTSPRIGLQAQYNISKKFSILAEWAYSHKQASFESEVIDQEQSFRQVIQNPPYAPIIVEGVIVISGTTVGAFDLQYLEFSLLPQYHFNNRFSMCLGGYAADLWRGTNKGVLTGGHLGISTQILEDIPFDNSDEIQRFDYGAIAGLSYKLFNNLHVNLRATRGFTSVYKPTFTRVDYEVRNTYLQLGADFRIPSRHEKYALVY